MAGQDRYLDTPPDGNRPTRVGGRSDMPADCSLTIRECGLPAAGNCRRICGHSSVGRTTPCQGVGRRFEAGCPLHSEAIFVFCCRHGGSVCAKGAPDKGLPSPVAKSERRGPLGGGAARSRLRYGRWKWTVGLLVRSPPFQGGQAGFESRTVYQPSRGWHMGCAPAFQAGQTSSSLVPRSRLAAVAQLGRALR